jgi:chlorobactene glucosyltransferase
VPNPLFAYQFLILAILLVLLDMVILNLRVLPRLSAHGPKSKIQNPKLALERSEGSKIAILVPARNEQANIEACLRSLLAQTYPDYQIWLYDDASTDHTLQIATRIASEANKSKIQNPKSKINIVEGTGDPPPGWLGKANACDQLYLAMHESSDPDYILFTDADVRHDPETLARAVATAQATGAGLLSIFPRQETLTWAERLAVPLMQHWAVYGILPLSLAFSPRTGPAFAAANGQFMLFTREAYKACGGHTAVRDQILEDVGMARAVKRAGYRAILADGGPYIHTRMYSGFDEVWRGYSKNTYAFFGNSPLFLALGILVLMALYVVPPALILYATITGQFSLELFYLPLAQYSAAVLTRLLLAVRFASRLLDAFLHPISILFLIAILLNSMLWKHTGKRSWKGRMSA